MCSLRIRLVMRLTVLCCDRTGTGVQPLLNFLHRMLTPLQVLLLEPTLVQERNRLETALCTRVRHREHGWKLNARWCYV